MILTAAPLKRKAPLVPILAAVAVAAVAAAGYFYVQTGRGADALAAATAQAEQSSAQLVAARARVRALELELATQRTQLDSVLKTTLPVEVSFRVGDPGTGYVAHIENHSTEPMALVVEPHRARTGEYGRIELAVPPQGSAEVTEKLGWAFKSGDTLSVSAGEYRPLSLAVP